MPKYIICLLVCLVAAACSSSPADEGELQDQNTSIASSGGEPMPDKQGSRWVEYADAKADANLALAQGDTRLLAFANRMLNFPGLDPAAIEKIKTTCGYRVLSGTGDMLNIGDDVSLRSKLREYATTYNQVVYAACVDNQGK